MVVVVLLLLQHVTEERVLLVRQILERQFVALALVQIHGVATPVLPPQDNVQCYRRRDSDAIAYHHALPQLGVVLVNGLAVYELRPDDVANGVGNEDGGRHDGFLGRAGDVTGTESDDKADDRSKETGDGVSGNWNCRVVTPFGLPDHHAAGNDGKTAGDEHGDARVRDAHADVAAERDEDEADATYRELEQDGVEGVVAKG